MSPAKKPVKKPTKAKKQKDQDRPLNDAELGQASGGTSRLNSRQTAVSPNPGPPDIVSNQPGPPEIVSAQPGPPNRG